MKSNFSIFFLPALIVCCLIAAGEAQKPGAVDKPVVPRTWDERALADLEVPLADASHSPRHISAEDYYRIPVRPIYKTYPKYHPDKEPPGSGLAQTSRAGRSLGRRPAPSETRDRGRLIKAESSSSTLQSSSDRIRPPSKTCGHSSRRRATCYDSHGISPFTFYVVRNPQARNR